MQKAARPATTRTPDCHRLASIPCVRELTAGLTGHKTRVFRDFTKEKPAPDSVFQIYKRMFDYDRSELKSKIESEEDSEFWKKQKISFDAAYGNERVPAYLFLPKNASPPYQTVIFFPGANVRRAGSSRQLESMSKPGLRRQRATNPTFGCNQLIPHARLCRF